MALRVFFSREGDEWRVWSVVPDISAAVTLDEEFRGGWLCFEQVDGGERRRLTLTEAPAAWDALPDERLDLLRRVAALVAAPPLDSDSRVTARRPVEDASRYQPSAPKSIVGRDQAELR